MKRSAILFLSLIIVVFFSWQGCAQDQPVEPVPADEDVTWSYVTGLQIGPIDGLTTKWHRAPDRFAVPQDAQLHIRCLAPANAEVSWTGAVEIERGPFASVAKCPTDALREHRESVVVAIPTSGGDGNKGKDDPLGTSSTYACSFNVVDIAIEQIRVRDIEVSREPLHVDENSSNWQTLRQFQSGSIAEVRRVAPNRYVTAAGTKIRLSARTEPRVFAPLTEWRINGKAELLGEYGNHQLKVFAGTRTVSVGPPRNPHDFEIDTYRAYITGNDTGTERIPVGLPVTFEAMTDPPGFEDEIVWRGR